MCFDLGAGSGWLWTCWVLDLCLLVCVWLVSLLFGFACGLSFTFGVCGFRLLGSSGVFDVAGGFDFCESCEFNSIVCDWRCCLLVFMRFRGCFVSANCCCCWGLVVVLCCLSRLGFSRVGG